MGASMTGLRPIAEIMFADFFAVCWDIVANEIAKSRYMTQRSVDVPTGGFAQVMVVACRFGAQHSQKRGERAMISRASRSLYRATPTDVIGLYGGLRSRT